jgi:hypothetical protein
MNRLILEFSYLQILDFLTTIAFLLKGLNEANPLVRAAMALSASPVVGLFLVKAAAIALGVYCWRMGRQRTLTRVNVIFAAVVVWNLFGLILGTVVKA